MLNTLLYVTALGVLLIGPIWLVILGGRLVFVLARHWARLLTWQRRLGLLVIVISLGTLALMVSPLGQRMLVWFD